MLLTKGFVDWGYMCVFKLSWQNKTIYFEQKTKTVIN